MGKEKNAKKTKKEKKDEEVRQRKGTKTEILKRDVFNTLSVDWSLITPFVLQNNPAAMLAFQCEGLLAA